MRNSTCGVCRCGALLEAATSVLKQWMICGWLSRKATSKVPAAGSLTVELYTPGATSRRLRSMTSAARALWPRLA
ncbi:hypothetical protein D9M71_822230 [compost metagenome]